MWTNFEIILWILICFLDNLFSYERRKEYLVGILEAEALKFKNQARFILEKIENKITIENRKKLEMIGTLQDGGYDSDLVKAWKESEKYRFGQGRIRFWRRNNHIRSWLWFSVLYDVMEFNTWKGYFKNNWCAYFMDFIINKYIYRYVILVDGNSWKTIYILIFYTSFEFYGVVKTC